MDPDGVKVALSFIVMLPDFFFIGRYRGRD